MAQDKQKFLIVDTEFSPVKDTSPDGLGLCYLAGPMFSLPEHNLPAFAKAAKALRDLGYRVLSPGDLCETPVNVVSHEDYGRVYGHILARDLLLVSECNTIVFLEGWENSRGAKLEWHFGSIVGKQMILLKDVLCSQK